MDTLFDPPRAAVTAALERSRERAELRPDADLGLAVDALTSLIHYRLMFAHAPVGEPEIQAAVETVLRGIAAGYAALHPAGKPLS